MSFSLVQSVSANAEIGIDPPGVTVSALAEGSFVAVIVSYEGSAVPTVDPPTAAGITFDLAATSNDGSARILQLWYGRVSVGGATAIAVTTDAVDGFCLVTALEYTTGGVVRLVHAEVEFDTANFGTFVYLNPLSVTGSPSVVVTAVLWAAAGGSPDVEVAPGFTERVDHTSTPQTHIQDQFDAPDGTFTEWTATDIGTFLSVGASFVLAPEPQFQIQQPRIVVPRHREDTVRTLGDLYGAPVLATPGYVSPAITPYVGQRADALQFFHTGAISHAAPQPHQQLSLGGFRASTRAAGRSFLLYSAIPGLMIDYASGRTSLGDGSIVSDGTALRFTAPGGSPGPDVVIAPGEQRVLEDGDDPNQFLLVSVPTGATLRPGACTIQFLETLNNVVGMANYPVTTSPRYRCLALACGPLQLVQNLKIWIEDNDHAFEIGIQSPSAGGSVPLLANETEVPAGVSFVAPDAIGHADVITVTELRPGDWRALWLKSDGTAVATPEPWAAIELRFAFNAFG